MSKRAAHLCSIEGTELRLIGQGSADLRMNYSVNTQQTSPARLSTSTGDIGKVRGMLTASLSRPSLIRERRMVIWSLDGLSPFEETTVHLSPYEGELRLDYVAYKPIDNHVEQGESVVLDDAHPYIVYYGKDGEGFIPVMNASTAVGVPFGGTWSRSSKVGSSLTTTFRGGELP